MDICKEVDGKRIEKIRTWIITHAAFRNTPEEWIAEHLYSQQTNTQ